MNHVELRDHACVIHRSSAERSTAVAAFVRRSLEERNRVFYVVADRTSDQALDELACAGLDVRDHVGGGQLEVGGVGEAYLRRGGFDAGDMTVLLRDKVRAARTDGWEGFAVIGEMAWVVDAGVAVRELADYERQVDDVFRSSRAKAVCLYDAERFDHPTLDEMAALHPLLASEPCDGPVARWDRAQLIRCPDGALAVSGEVDLANAAGFAASIEREAAVCGKVRLDLRDLRFMDVTGMTALLDMSRSHVRVELVHAPRIVRSILEMMTEGHPGKLSWEPT